VRARPTGRVLRRVLAVGLLTMLTSPLLIIWEVNLLVVMCLVVLIRPAWRAPTYVLRWGMLLASCRTCCSGWSRSSSSG